MLFPQLTVEETLVFSAFLRLPGSMSRQEKYARVEMIMKALGLERYNVQCIEEHNNSISFYAIL